MAEPLDKQVVQQMIKWGIGIIGMLIVAGAGSLATQNVYSKTEADVIHKNHEASVEKELDHMREVQEMQYDYANEQLDLIRGDLHEVKTILRAQK